MCGKGVWFAVFARLFLFAVLALCGCTDVSAGSDPLTAIPVIQGRGDASPLADRAVSVQGVVTAVFPKLHGFYLQDEVGDGDGATSDGIFVYTKEVPTVAVGDRVRLDATVAEYHAVTELVKPTNLQVLGQKVRIAPVSVRFPLEKEGDLERYEGMLVRIDDELTVSQNHYQGRYGQLTLSAGGRLQKPTNLYRPRSKEAIALASLNARSRIILDDGSSAQNPDPVPFLEGGVLRVGDRLRGLVGVVDHGPATSDSRGARAYRIHPVETPVFVHANPRAPLAAAVENTVRVAGFNVQNFFSTINQAGARCAPSNTRTDCRGADSLEELARQRDKIVSALVEMNADAIGLMELQNNGDEALRVVVDALNARAGKGVYAFLPEPAGGLGNDAIKVGLIYRPSRLKPLGLPVADLAKAHSRVPLAQVFSVKGKGAGTGALAVVVSHFKSKSCEGAYGEDADAHDGQGCWNAKRVNQAKALLAFSDRFRRSGVKDVLMLGDFNAYGAEEPVITLADAGWKELVTQRDPHAYSYVFDGESGVMDHAFATPSLAGKVVDAKVWHINADEPAVMDYHMEYKKQDFYAPTPFRSSDHDPVVVDLRVGKLVR